MIRAILLYYGCLTGYPAVSIMDEQEFLMGVEEDLGPEIDISVSVKCPHCPRSFKGGRDAVEEELPAEEVIKEEE